MNKRISFKSPNGGHFEISFNDLFIEKGIKFYLNQYGGMTPYLNLEQAKRLHAWLTHYIDEAESIVARLTQRGPDHEY
jgi:hypothetical protein